MKYFVDFEAAQFSNEIIAIGCVNELGDTYYSLVSAKKKISSFITNLTGLTQDMIDDAPTADVVFSRFFSWCAHTAGKDVPEFLCYGNTDTSFTKTNFKSATDFRAKAILGYLSTGLVDYAPLVQKHFGLIKQIGLAKVADYYRGYSLVQTHNALDDAQLLKYVYEQIQLHNDDPEDDAFLEYKDTRIVVEQSYIVERLKGKEVVETYESLREAGRWAYNQMQPDQRIKGPSMIDHCAKRIKNAAEHGTKYFEHKWKMRLKVNDNQVCEKTNSD